MSSLYTLEVTKILPVLKWTVLGEFVERTDALDYVRDDTDASKLWRVRRENRVDTLYIHRQGKTVRVMVGPNRQDILSQWFGERDPAIIMSDVPLPVEGINRLVERVRDILWREYSTEELQNFNKLCQWWRDGSAHVSYLSLGVFRYDRERFRSVLLECITPDMVIQEAIRRMEIA